VAFSVETRGQAPREALLGEIGYLSRLRPKNLRIAASGVDNSREGPGKFGRSADGKGLPPEDGHRVANGVANGRGRKTKSRIEYIIRDDYAASSRVAVVADWSGSSSGVRWPRVARRAVLNVNEDGMCASHGNHLARHP